MSRPITLEDEIAEIQREIFTRERVYPRWIDQRKISRSVANHRLAILYRILNRLRAELPTQAELFNTNT